MSSLDQTMLRLLKHREHYERWARAVPRDAIQPATLAILKDYQEFFKANPDATVAEPSAFFPFFRLAHPKLKEDKAEMFQQMILASEQDVPVHLLPGVSKLLQDAAAAVDMTKALEQYNAGEEVDLGRVIREVADRVPPDSSNRIQFVRPDIHDLLNKSEDDWGFKWRLSCMNEACRPLIPGDFVIMAARVDKGKSTWLLSEATYWAPQVDLLFPGENRIILYLNNEGLGDRLYQRTYNSALGMSVIGLSELSRAGTLDSEFLKAQGGREVIYIVDVHDRPLSYLEEVVRRTRPAIVITDMLDNVPYDGSVTNGGTRTDQIIEAAYQRARIWGVKYGCVSIAASQLDATADGEMFPKLSQLANSKTGKPGAADLIAMMGFTHDVMLENTRYISLPKNKLARPTGRKDPRAAVTFQGPEGRLIDARVA